MVAGEHITHGERGDGGMLRLYVFVPDDNAEMFHHKHVCEEQEQQTFIEVFDLVKG